MSAITSATRGALLILEAAESASLPLPVAVTPDRFGAVRLQMGSLDDLAAWSLYMEEPIDSGEPSDEGAIVHYVRGALFEQSVNGFAVTYASEVAA